MTNNPVLKTVEEYLAPLVFATKDPMLLIELIDDVGFKIELNTEQAKTVSEILNFADVIKEIKKLVDDVEAKKIDSGTATELGIQILLKIKDQAESLKNVKTDLLLRLPKPLDDKNWWSEFALLFVGHLLIKWIQLQKSFIYEALFFAGIISETARPNSKKIDRKIHWDKLGDFFNDPSKQLDSVYKFSTMPDHVKLITNLGRLLKSFGIGVENESISSTIANQFVKNNSNFTQARQLSLKINSSSSGLESNYVSPKIGLAAIPDSKTQGKVGYFLNASLITSIPNTLDINEDWQIDFSHIIKSLQQNIGVVLYQDRTEFAVTLPEPKVILKFIGKPNKPWVLFGNPEGMRLEVNRLCGEFGIADEGHNKANVHLALTTIGGSEPGIKFVISTKGADNFVTQILGEKEFAVTADLGIKWSTLKGFEIEGELGFKLVIPVNLVVGPIKVNTVHLALSGDKQGLRMVAAVSGGLDLGVLKASAQELGLKASLLPAAKGKVGKLGDLDFELGFQPPKGWGLAIDAAGVVKGGGFLSFEKEKGQYAGVGEIKFAQIGLTAVGVLNTKLDYDPKAWSLFLSVFSEFAAIQLSFGFTLNGVGGIVGINRTMKVDILRERMSSGALNSIMFPEDPIANAPKIIADIVAVFPPAKSQFVFGAIFKIGWGTPSLVIIKAGVLVEAPKPVRLVLIGQLEMVLPNKEAAVLEIYMDILGVFDINAKTISIDASLRDSKVVGVLKLTGDMAFRSNFGDNPLMMLSIGGYHPRFKAPSEFPKLKLLKASLSLGKMVQVSVACYMAVTSNTFQFGGRVDIWAGFDGFSISGYLMLDALIQFVPFAFYVRVGFGVSVKAGQTTLLGIDVTGDLSGPKPFEMIGKGSFKVLGFKVNVKVEFKSGKSEKNQAIAYNVEQLLLEAFKKSENYTFLEDSSSRQSVKLKDSSSEQKPRLLPNGKILFTQKVVPLDRQIEVFGNGKITGRDKFEVEYVSIGSKKTAAANLEVKSEWFASSQYYNLNDNEKLSAPSFELMPSGFNIGSEDFKAGAQAELVIMYEEIIIDKKLVVLSKTSGGLITQKPKSVVTKVTAALPTKKYVAVSVATGKRFDSLAKASSSSYFEMRNLVKAHNKKTSNSAAHLQVMTEDEL